MAGSVTVSMKENQYHNCVLKLNQKEAASVISVSYFDNFLPLDISLGNRVVSKLKPGNKGIKVVYHPSLIYTTDQSDKGTTDHKNAPTKLLAFSRKIRVPNESRSVHCHFQRI